MTEDLISRKALLDDIDGIYDCADMVFKPNDHCCKPSDCPGCKWVQTKNYIRRLVANAPAVTQTNLRRNNTMLNIGQDIFVVCKLFTSADKFKIYVSRKEINRVERNQDGQIIYTAGRHNELRFMEIPNEDGTTGYQSLGIRKKRVFLTREEAEVERKIRLEEEEELASAKEAE